MVDLFLANKTNGIRFSWGQGRWTPCLFWWWGKWENNRWIRRFYWWQYPAPGGRKFLQAARPKQYQEYPKFHGQTRNSIEAIYEDDEPFYDHEDQQPELYTPEDRKYVTFDKFKGFERSIKKFKKTLKNFKNSKNQLFDAVIYGIMYYRCSSEQIVQEKIIEVLGENLFNDLKEI